MARTVGIIDAGIVGTSAAMFLVEHNLCDEIIIYDKDIQKAQAEAIDIIDTLAFASSYVNIYATDDLATISDTKIIIYAKDSETNNVKQSLEESAKNIIRIFPQLIEAGFNGFVINASAPSEALTMLIQEVTGLPKTKVMGTGTVIETQKIYRILSQSLQINPRDFEGFVLGAHLDDPVIAWSTLRVNGYPLEDLNPQEELDFASVKSSLSCCDYDFKKSSKKTSHFSLGKIASVLVDSIFSGSNRILPVATYHNVYDCYISTPAVISRLGIKQRLSFDLPQEERSAFEESIKKVRKLYTEEIEPLLLEK